MVQRKKFIGMKTEFQTDQSHLHCIGYAKRKSRKPVAAQSEIGNLAGLQLQLQFVRNQGDKFGIRGFSLGIGNCVPKEPLKGIQIATIPGNLNGMSDSTFHAAGGGLECFCHLGV